MTQFLDQYEAPFTYAHVATATGTVTANIKAAAGALYAVNVNSKATAAAPLTIFDSTSASGTIIGVIDPTVNVQTLFFNCAFKNGLSYQSATASTSGDYTFIYV